MSKIVIIEDSPTQTLRTSLALRRGGHTVICAVDGRDGLDKAFWNRPEVVILDINLPDMDGFTVCQLLKNDARTRNTAVIMHTAQRELNTLINTRQAGADFCVFKSGTSDDELIEHIEAVNKAALQANDHPEQK